MKGAIKRYKDKYITKLQVDLNKKTDADILEQLENNKPVAAYIKNLIRLDMQKEK